MKLSQRTVNVLKNFSNINNGIVITPGSDSSQQLIISGSGRKVIAIADIEERFENQVAFYDLNQFLSAYTKTKEEVVVEFSENNAVIRYGGNASARIPYSDPELIYELDKNGNPTPFPENVQSKMLTLLGNPITSIQLSEKQLSDLLTMGGVLGLDNMTIRPVNGKIVVRMFNVEENAAGETHQDKKTYDIEVGEYEGTDFNVDINLDLLKLIPDDYVVTITPKISQWSSQNQALTYFIGTRPTSKYGE